MLRVRKRGFGVFRVRQRGFGVFRVRKRWFGVLRVRKRGGLECLGLDKEVVWSEYNNILLMVSNIFQIVESYYI